ESDDEQSDVAESPSADTLPDTGGSSMVLIPLGSLLVLAGSMMVGRRKAEEQ
ncbi:MAG: LPXTG cell wall anchor domain-containing protein, partial [Aeromicrobium sp.]